MENKNINIDQILLSKSYNELTKEELLAIQDSISSESEFNDLKAMLVAATKELQNSKDIEPKKETKAFLMKEFSKVHPATQTNSGAGGLGFLFPKDKAFYQKPGYQLLAVAAVLVLIFTVFPKITGDMTSGEDMAQHTIDEPENGTPEQTKNLEDSKLAEDATVKNETNKENIDQKITNTNIAIENPEQATLKEKDSEEIVSVEDEVAYDTYMVYDGTEGNSAGSADVIYSIPPAQEVDNVDPPTDMDLAVMDSEVNTDEDKKASEVSVPASSGYNESTTAGNYGGTDAYNSQTTDDEIAMANEEEVLLEEVAEMETLSSKVIAKERLNKSANKAPLKVKKVKSLAENAELIDLFYTAM